MKDLKAIKYRIFVNFFQSQRAFDFKDIYQNI